MPLRPVYAIIAMVVLLSPARGEAGVSLSVNPTDGSNALRLESAAFGLETKKEIRVRINSTGGRYQVFQRILEPILNEKGENLAANGLQTATTVSSNSVGTLYAQAIERLSMADQLLYSSTPSGDSDAFTIAYGIDPERLNAAGNFNGKLMFTVRSLNDGSSDQAIVNVQVRSQTKFKATVVGGHALNRVSVSEGAHQADFVQISFSGSQSDIRVYQDFEQPPINEEGVSLLPDALMISGEPGAEGIKVSQAVTAGRGRSLIYASRKGEDQFSIFYSLAPESLSQVEPGTYRGKLRFEIETHDGSATQQIDLECRIQPILKMDIVFPEGEGGGVNFRRVLPNEGPQEKEVVVKVQSNLRKPYQVSQLLGAPMSNAQGKEMQKQSFQIKVEVLPGQKGRSRFEEFVPVPTGEQSIFNSDSKGSSSEFRVIYRLQGYPGMSPGTFAAPLRYSLNQN